MLCCMLCVGDSEKLALARVDAEKAKADAEKAKADAEKFKADAEKAKMEVEKATQTLSHSLSQGVPSSSRLSIADLLGTDAVPDVVPRVDAVITIESLDAKLAQLAASAPDYNFGHFNTVGDRFAPHQRGHLNIREPLEPGEAA